MKIVWQIVGFFQGIQLKKRFLIFLSYSGKGLLNCVKKLGITVWDPIDEVFFFGLKII